MPRILTLATSCAGHLRTRARSSPGLGPQTTIFFRPCSTSRTGFILGGPFVYSPVLETLCGPPMIVCKSQE